MEFQIYSSFVKNRNKRNTNIIKGVINRLQVREVVIFTKWVLILFFRIAYVIIL